MKHTLKEIVKGENAKLQYVCNGKLIFYIKVNDSLYSLEIDSNSDDWKATYIMTEMKTIYLMRWIRKGIENNDNTFIQLK